MEICQTNNICPVTATLFKKLPIEPSALEFLHLCIAWQPFHGPPDHLLQPIAHAVSKKWAGKCTGSTISECFTKEPHRVVGSNNFRASHGA